jgi:N6-L-threonylcarbamoyladenine synthase
MREATVQPSAQARIARRGADKHPVLRSDVSVNDVAASFQEALVEILVEKTVRAAKAYDAKEIFITGGVSANQALRQTLRSESELPVRYPPLNLCTDNAAMIAAAGHFRFEAGHRSDLDMDVLPMWPLRTDTYEQ